MLAEVSAKVLQNGMGSNEDSRGPGMDGPVWRRRNFQNAETGGYFFLTRFEESNFPKLTAAILKDCYSVESNFLVLIISHNIRVKMIDMNLRARHYNSISITYLLKIWNLELDRVEYIHC